MSGAGGHEFDVSDLASVEEQLAASLSEAAADVARTEGFDAEQRAEIYSILEAMKSNSEIHRAKVKLLLARKGQPAGHA